VRGVNPPKESKNGSVARWLAGGDKTTELTSAGRKIWRRGGYFPLAWVLIAGGEREGAVPHVSDSRPMARRNGWTVAHTGAPIFGLWRVGLGWQFKTGTTEMA
jgi:hypothetical protein